MDSTITNDGSDSQNIAAKGAALLLVTGEPFTEDHKTLILEEVTKAFKCWDCESTGININDELAQIANKADLGEEGPDASPYGFHLKEGERIIRNNSDSLAVEILVNPQTLTLKNAVKQFLCVPTRHKHLVYSGHVVQGSGAWILQDDTYTFRNFAKAFTDSDVAKALKLQEGCSLHISTEAEGDWTNVHIQKSEVAKALSVKLNPEGKLDNLHGVIQFAAYINNFIKVRQLSDLLQSSDVVGNIRFTRPTLYIFPSCQGDSALFGISGFNLLVNGGFSRKACFWDFTRHLDRIDAALMTHLGTDNLFGFSSVLQRKSIDNVHPEIGGIFVNASDKMKALPEADENKKNGLIVNLAEEGNKLIQYAKQIGQLPHPCSRTPSGSTIDPINLYHKIGIGSLDMYILNPVTDSKEMKEFYQQWNQNVAQFGVNQHFSLPNMLSVCALLVWRPSDPKDNITRVFFPGNAPQHKVLEGLEKLKTLDILKHPVCNKETLAAKPAKKPGSVSHKPPTKKVSPITTPKEETPKKEPAAPKASSTPKAKPTMSAPKAKKEDVNKKTSKSAAPKEEKSDKTKSQSSSPSKASTKSSTPSTPKQLASPVKAEKVKEKAPEPAKPAEETALISGLAAENEALNGHADSSVDPPGFTNDLLEPSPVTEEADVPASVPEPLEVAREPDVVMDKNKMMELGIYDDDQDIEDDLNAQANQAHEDEQMYGGMTESMHEDYMGGMNAKNAMQSSFHGDLMSGSMHESMYDSKQPFDDPNYGVQDHSIIDEMTTPEDETSEEIQPQALPEPMAYAPSSYAQEPDVIPSMQAKDEPIQPLEAEPLQTQQEPDLLAMRQEVEDVSASHGFGEESTAPVEDKAPVELETPDEVENTFPEDEGFSQQEVQEKDVIEQTEKDLAALDKTEDVSEDVVKEEQGAESELICKDDINVDVDEKGDYQKDMLEATPTDEGTTADESFTEQDNIVPEPAEEEIVQEEMQAVDDKPVESVPHQSQDNFDEFNARESPEPAGFEEQNKGPEMPVKEEFENEPEFATEKMDEAEQDLSDEFSMQPETNDLLQHSAEDFGSMSEPTPKSDDMLQTPDDDLDKDQNIDISPDTQPEQERSITPEDLDERPKSPEPLELEQEMSTEDNAGAEQADFGQREPSPTKAESEELIDEPMSLQYEQSAETEHQDYRPETPESVERADSPDSQNRDSLDREIAMEPESMQDNQKVTDEQEREDSIERQHDQRESSERESEPRDSIERESDHGQHGPVSSDDQRDSIERSYEEEEEEETDDSEEGEESSSFEQENTDERCLIPESTSEHVDAHDGKPMDPDSLAAPFDSLMDQPSDNLLTPESETSHGGQLGYHQIGEQDDVDSVEDEKDVVAVPKPQSSHPFGQDFEEFGAPGPQTAHSTNPFDNRMINPFIGFNQPPPPAEEDSSPEDDFRAGGGPLDFDPLAEWGQPMGLPSPPPPEEKSAANGPGSAKKTQRPSSATKAADAKKSAADAKKPAANGIKKLETKRPQSAPKKPAAPASTKLAGPKASNGVPEKTKTPRPASATGPLNTTRTSTAANTSRLSLGGNKTATAKTRPASAPEAKSKEKSSNESLSKPKPNGMKKTTNAKTASSPSAVKMPPLPPFTAFYVDLTYIPNHGNPTYSDIDFFKRIRARHYVLSALSPDPQILDSLLEAKKTWEDKDLQVTVIPTYDNEALRLWMTLNKEKLAASNVDIAPSASRCTIQLQDHETSSSAYRLEF